MTKQEYRKYRQIRSDLGWSREYASEQLGMSDDKLERIENGRQIPNPQDVLIMSDVYRTPELCNYYCHNECEIGRQYVPEISNSELPDIVLRLLDAVYKVEGIDRILVSITADGTIDDDEVEPLVEVQNTLERLSVMIEALQLCVERKIDNGEISREAYEAALKKYIGQRKG